MTADDSDEIEVADGYVEIEGADDDATVRIKVADGWLEEVTETPGICDAACIGGSRDVERYSVLRRLSRDHCASLAPNFSDRCMAIRLVRIDAADVSVGIFGIVEDAGSGDAYVALLVSFDDGLYNNENHALNYVDDLEDNNLQARLAVPPGELRPSLRDLSRPVFLGITENYLVRIDALGASETGEENYRYAVWPAGSSMAAEPDLVLFNGEIDNERGEGWRSYSFANGNYRYVVSTTDGADETTGELTVSNGQNTLLSEKFLAGGSR